MSPAEPSTKVTIPKASVVGLALALCACSPPEARANGDACDLAIVGGQILVNTEEDPAGFIDDGFVAITGDKIHAVGPRAELDAACEAKSTIDATGMIVTPGFIDAHQHLGAMAFPQDPYEPATGPGLLSSPGAVEIFAPLISQIGVAPIPPEQVEAGVRQLLQAMMRVGYTGVIDAGGPHPDVVAAVAAEVGIRAMVGPHIADVWPNEVGQMPVSQADPVVLLEQAADFIDANDGLGDGLVRAGVSGVWTLTCSDELLAGLADLAATKDVPVHIHTNVLAEEAEVHASWFGGRTAIERLVEAGLLDERVTLMHAGVLSDADIELIAASGATVNHNPLGNAMLGFGVANQLAPPRMLAAGIPMVLGSDTSPVKLTSPFESMIAALAINREAAGDDFAFTLEDALQAATNGGVSLGRPDQLGVIAPGRLADLVLIRPDPPFLPGPTHPIPTVVLNGHAGQVDSVIINGRYLVPTDEG